MTAFWLWESAPGFFFCAKETQWDFFGTKLSPCQGIPVCSGIWSCSFHPSKPFSFLFASKHWEYPKLVTLHLTARITRSPRRAFSLMSCVAVIAPSKPEPGNKKGIYLNSTDMQFWCCAKGRSFLARFSHPDGKLKCGTSVSDGWLHQVQGDWRWHWQSHSGDTRLLNAPPGYSVTKPQ